MSTLSDIPYEAHRLIAVLALGFFVLGVVTVPLRRIRVTSHGLGAAVVLVPALLVVLVAGGVAYELAWAGDKDDLMFPVAGVICLFAWFSGMQLRNAELSPRARVVVILPFVLVVGYLWTRDAPPPIGAAAAARAFDAYPGQAGNRYVCSRYASTSSQWGIVGAQFECEPSHCKAGQCTTWWIAFGDDARIRTAVSPGGG